MSAGEHDIDYTAELPWIIRQGMGIQIMESLAVGAFLTAFALALGASNFVIGLLAAVPHLAQLAQIPAVYAVERIRRRRDVYVFSGWVARPMLLVVALAALLPSGSLALGVLIAALVVRYVAGAFLGCSWNSWMRDLVPDSRMGEVFGRRQQSMTLIGALAGLAAAGLVDLWRWLGWAPEIYGYSVLYALAFLGGSYSVWASRHIRDVPMGPPRELDLVKGLLHPFRDANFRKLLTFLASWSFAINLAAPFFTVNMLKRMELPLVLVVLLTTTSQVASYVMVTRWGRLADRFSNKSVLTVCGPLFIACIFAWTFVMFPEKHAGTIPLLFAIHVFTGIASAGVSLASGNMTLKLAPRGDATTYLATSSMLNAFAAGGAAMLGGLTADFFVNRQLSIVTRWQEPGGELDFTTLHLEQWDFFFMLAAAVGLYSLHRLSFVQEAGHVEERVVLQALAAETAAGVRASISSVPGVRLLSDFPLDLVRRAVSRNARGVAAPGEPSAEKSEGLVPEDESG